jgi:transposase
MSNKRKQYSPQFKFDRALEAIKSANLSEISRKYGVSVNVLSNWRSELLKRGAQTFTTTPDQENNRLRAKIAKLEQMLGKKEVELNVLKNFSDFYASQDTP